MLSLISFELRMIFLDLINLFELLILFSLIEFELGMRISSSKLLKIHLWPYEPRIGHCNFLDVVFDIFSFANASRCYWEVEVGGLLLLLGG